MILRSVKDMGMTKVRLDICGSYYVVSTNDDEQYLHDIAARLDESLTEFMTANPSASITTAAVLTALGFLDELSKSQTNADNMRAQIKDYLEDAARSKMELEDTKRELNKTRREFENFKKGEYGAHKKD